MDLNQEASIKIKLLQLECHFTWGLRKVDPDLKDLQDRLQEQIGLGHGGDTGTICSYNLLAYVNHLQGFNEEALENLRKAEEFIKKQHGDEYGKFLSITYGDFAWVYHHMGDLSKVQSYLDMLDNINKRFLATSPADLQPAVYGEKGWSCLKYNRKYYTTAKECFEKALIVEPENADWNAGYAIALYRLEGFESERISAKDSAALKQLRRALELNPEDCVIMVLLGLKLAHFKKNKEAEELVEKALEMSPDNPYVTRYVAKFFRQNGLLEKSIKLLNRALERTPNSGFIHHQIALGYKKKKIALSKNGNYVQKSMEIDRLRRLCIYHLEKATTQKPSFIYAGVELALLYAECKNTERAEELFQRMFSIAKEKNEDIQIVHYYYGDFQLYHKRSEHLAIKHYKEACEGKDKKCLYKLKSIAENHISKSPHDAEAYGILGFVHRMKDEKIQAIECYEKALLGDLGNGEYLAALCDLRLSLI
ncbi:interferon-induced protein with tetratricopeptide repeats 5-like [Lepisosteus oculatus]|uniref:interferon-induced protein with tetratricopeptide repeats 5-like n=1 Tax=Lepisosteus oculatus TaxID=7918 RepID=UPI0037237DA6